MFELTTKKSEPEASGNPSKTEKAGYVLDVALKCWLKGFAD